MKLEVGHNIIMYKFSSLQLQLATTVQELWSYSLLLCSSNLIVGTSDS